MPPLSKYHTYFHHHFIFISRVAKMPKWEDIRDDLFEAIIQANPPISKEQQVEIVATMNARGHDMGWNAIRYVPPSSTIWLSAGPELEKDPFVLLAAQQVPGW